MGVIIFVGLVTALYTATGGLLVSIITDQAQVGPSTDIPPAQCGIQALRLRACAPSLGLRACAPSLV
jgi:hypothetical protein